MVTLKRYGARDEKEVHSIIEKEIEALEEGLRCLKHEFQCGDRGTVDFLFADSGNRLGLIEVKKDKDDEMLFQGLRYYDWVCKNRYAVANMFPDEHINPNETPRLVLVAGQVSDDLRSLSTHIVPDVELYEYSLLETDEGEMGIYFHPVSLPKIIDLSDKEHTIEDVLNYMTDSELKTMCREVMEEIKSIHNSIDVYATTDYIGFKYKGRLVAVIHTHRKAFDIEALKLDDNLHISEQEFFRIQTGDENYSGQLDIIRETLQKLGADLPDEE